jgi:membrane protein implicated in regulation of membrane protease activity
MSPWWLNILSFIAGMIVLRWLQYRWEHRQDRTVREFNERHKRGGEL